ncbi:xylulokinase [Grimontia sp. NTOU-MAR1]|uniref:xylulokinase n=1 Tax=Grimontia sp. NTOU-MAR1 TaxID=3111011 RepID=UPI002DB8288C|nr:xylulokinase [Grimontia sp. NTOU-MAR1]WRW00397.1 xylulokinase [Grimontia sp. NTOU-MAR1]
MATYLGIDVGTSAVKVILMGESGEVLDSQSESYGFDAPHPLWREQNPEIWWQGTQTAITKIRTRQSYAWSAVAAIGLSGQMHGAVCLDEQNKPVRPAILWNDGRAFKECERLNQQLPHLGESAGVPAMPGFTAPKLLWLKQFEPDVFSQIHTAILPKDYVRLKLTGELCTDVSDAAGTLWLNEQLRNWDESVLAASGITLAQMPKLIEGNEISGTLTTETALAFGLSVDTPVCGGGGDAAAGGVGIGAINEGDAFVSLGTSGQLFVAKERYTANPKKLVHAFAHAIPDRWYQMACLLNGASPLAWFASICGQSVSDLLEEAEQHSTESSAEMFLPYLSGERTPHNNPFATGSFQGMTSTTERHHMTQAILEGIAYSLRDCLNALSEKGLPFHELGAIGGGARSRYWLQMIADVLEVPINQYIGSESGPALGAARLAKLSIKDGTPESTCIQPTVSQVFEPRREKSQYHLEKYQRFAEYYCQLYGAKNRHSED